MTGDQVPPPQGGPSSPGGFKSELNSVDDGDDTKSRIRRGLRGVIRNSESVDKQVKDTTKTTYQVTSDFDPWGKEAKTETRASDPPQKQSATPHQEAGDVVGNLLLATAFTLEVMTRSNRRRKG